MLGQRSGRIILGNPEAGNATIIRMLQQPKGGAGYCDSLDILLQWNSAPFTAGDAIPLSIQIKGASLVIRAFLSRFEIPRPRPSSRFTLTIIITLRNYFITIIKKKLPYLKSMQIQNMRVGGANAVKNQLEKLESKKFRERKH